MSSDNTTEEINNIQVENIRSEIDIHELFNVENTVIWDTASGNQKSVYKTYSQKHNEEIRKIFPGVGPSAYADVLFIGDSLPTTTNTTNTQTFGEMYWDGTDM
ncbi:hypothetical protein RCL_jg21700.t1 [Rhizophagus clarus]|uniref:Uncharacterized protein n=1 Tax=Rhizophagus clarus TaxID=94130 RepID=A0A8H3QJD8_9GLOM|nr:hypothetical protein RCL_jg21700.t1 [Rhizophagus clarus]